eukprot:TRINITY_DN4679_c0_g1_i2.p1 TRINITY_DN4679_c0_g1~~TRINITY_DN4679_c0_g1_i2.p1  ORF type:complete len:214 (-),score=40.50 TRINITY_DN4679_c0_g1_i2:255-896(-)
MSIKNVGFATDKNSPHRRRMEDTHVIIESFDDKSSFFAVYDGHGGVGASQFCEKNLHQYLLEEISSLKGGEINAETFHKVYKKIDESMKDTVPAAGACVVTALIRQVGDKKILYVANAGDSRAILSRAGKAVQLTHDHTPEDEAEAKAIKDKGGFIKGGKVNGMIAITRALGDLHMKGYLSNEPYFTRTELNPDDEFLILACDGVQNIRGVTN